MCLPGNYSKGGRGGIEEKVFENVDVKCISKITNT